MKFYFITILILLCTGLLSGGKTSSNSAEIHASYEMVIKKSVLLDKIKGGWAGQMIGVTYGGPTEFSYKSTIIPYSVDIPWPDSGYCRWWFDNQPGLFDDIYMDLTFVEVIEEFGLNASVEQFSSAIAHAEYPLWHANQMARYNILNGLLPPESGHWLHNPHADDIDFQIEADFAGLMSPGMPVSASQICDRIGHIMTHGDGWYGGVYVAAMYSQAFISENIETVVRTALEMLPPESTFYACIADVIEWSSLYPDWTYTWQLIENKWGKDLGCPKGFADPYNIDAKLNCAYIVMGLLYGQGDMGRTVDISTRCGQDSDCNPSNAAGILGTLLGYSNIPKYWLNNVIEVEDHTFPYTNLSLHDAYAMSMDHALKMIAFHGGKIFDDEVVILCQTPIPVRLEKNFEGITPVNKHIIWEPLTDKGYSFEFEGTGILVSAQFPGGESSVGNYTALVDIWLNGKLEETIRFPANHRERKPELYWNFQLPENNYLLDLKLQNPDKDQYFRLNYIITYDKTSFP